MALIAMHHTDQADFEKFHDALASSAANASQRHVISTLEATRFAIPYIFTLYEPVGPSIGSSWQAFAGSHTR